MDGIGKRAATGATVNHGVIRLGLCLALAVTTLGAPPIAEGTLAGARSPADASDAWWDAGWPYRLRVDAAGSGIVSAGVNSSAQFGT